MTIKKNNRKSEHIRLAVEQFEYKHIMQDVELLHNCMPELDVSEVETTTSLGGYKLEKPILLNAITGGAPESYELNGKLARVARDHNLPIAVGSQKKALQNENNASTFEVIREMNPDGLILANLGAYASPKMAQEAVDMISADLLQLHLNVPQELCMPEGDSSFAGYRDNLMNICEQVEVPVIVKEVGFGMKMEEVQCLSNLNVAGIDIGGKGGTNFSKLENSRRSSQDRLFSLENWGISTSKSLLEALETISFKQDLIASGGFSSALDITKALALGSNVVGLAGYPLYLLWTFGEARLSEKLHLMEQELRYLSLLCGAKNLNSLSKVPAVITGETKEYADARGIDLQKYAQRSA